MACLDKRLTAVDVENRLVIPADFVRHLPQYEGGYTVFFPVQDVDGRVWGNFGYHIRKGPSYPKPVFQGDWRRYVREKRLSVGDRIFFRVEQNAGGGGVRYTIAARRGILLFPGVYLWCEEF